MSKTSVPMLGPLRFSIPSFESLRFCLSRHVLVITTMYLVANSPLLREPNLNLSFDYGHVLLATTT